MKKILFMLLFLLTYICCKGQKNYLYYNLDIQDSHVKYKCDGDAPSGLKDGKLKTLGDFLNDLGSHGYKLEKINIFYVGNMRSVAIFSKNTNQNETYSYVSIIRNSNKYTTLSGNVPSGNNWENISIDALLSELSKYSFQLDFHTFNQYVRDSFIENIQELFILSKRDTGSGSSVRNAKSYNNETKEIARYNIKGVAVDRNYKGVQIIVYSDYTTKIINKK